MATRINNPAIQHFDKSTGAQLSGGQMFFFESATTTPKIIFADAAETIPIANPVILDGNGFEPDIFGIGTYRIVLQNAAGVQQWERDPVEFETAGQAFNDWLSSVTYSIDDIVKGSDGLFYISILNNNLNNDPTIPANSIFWSVFDLLKRWNIDENYLIGDVVRSVDSGSIYTAVASQIGNDPDTDDGTNWKFIDNVKITGNTITVTNTNGNLNLEPNGTGELRTAGEVIGLAQVSQQIFLTPEAGTWTKPANVKYIMLEMIGGGGQGGGAVAVTPAVNRGGGGGGGGGYIREFIDVTNDASATFFVGRGGGLAPTTAGEDTTFSLTTSVARGGGAGQNATSIALPTGGFGGSNIIVAAGALSIRGGDGEDGWANTTNVLRSGFGGDTFYAGITKGRSGATLTGGVGSVPGGGGSGGASSGTGTVVGGFGAAGAIIITEFR